MAFTPKPSLNQSNQSINCDLYQQANDFISKTQIDTSHVCAIFFYHVVGAGTGWQLYQALHRRHMVITSADTSVLAGSTGPHMLPNMYQMLCKQLLNLGPPKHLHIHYAF